MKAHSSRVPGKNFREIAGKPLFRWVLDTLLELDFIEKIVVNTDARRELVEKGFPESDRCVIKDRARNLVGDDVSMNRIIADDIQSHPADHYLMTHTTNPVLKVATLSDAYSRYLSGVEAGKDSLFGVNRFQTRFYTEEVQPINHDPNHLVPTQDLEPWFEENSCYYFFSERSFSKTNARIGAHPVMHETPALENTDIDEWRDWYLAEAVLKMDLDS
ncbi:MAG: acylneuraminate cytidylyltransferase family protein [Pseudomonadales bacterium]|nr:acylneuraminate cytidylyltransferase family protein [Pseudomonadales bacterium]